MQSCWAMFQRDERHDGETEKANPSCRCYKHSRPLPYEPAHDKTSKMTCAPSKDSSLLCCNIRQDLVTNNYSYIRVCAVHSMGSLGPKVSSCVQWRLWSDWVDAWTDLSLCWARRSFCWFCHVQAHMWDAPAALLHLSTEGSSLC